MTALENVAVPLELLGARDAFERARAELDAVGLGARCDHYPGQLSGGEQQRVALARAMAPEPNVLFADEPTGNLDGATGADVADLLFALHAKKRTTLFLVTHEEVLAKRCARIVRLKDGAIVADERMSRDMNGFMTGFAWRLARRELRGGLKGFRIFFACWCWAWLAIAGIGFAGAGDADGPGPAGPHACSAAMSQVELVHRPANAAGACVPRMRYGRVSETTTMRAMAYARDERRRTGSARWSS